ncbi:hypothetical protein L7F22_020319 [Adiantum nelumboides]|nr:hypothetical protein [Adiantum nelumboides]
MNKKDKLRAQGRKRRERGHPLLHLHHRLPLLTKVVGILLKKRSYAAWKRSSKLKKFKEGGKNISFLTYDGTFGATDKVPAFIQQFDATFVDEGFMESSKLRHIAMHFQKSAKQWWASLRANGEASKTWKALRASILKKFLTSDAKDKVLTEWRSLKLTPYESTHKYVDKFWELHLKATVYKKIVFEEQKQQFCAGLPEDMNESHNEEAHAAAQAMIGQLYVIRTDSPLYLGRESLEKEEGFLQTSLLPAKSEKSNKYASLRRAKRKDMYGQAYNVTFTIGASLVKNVKAWQVLKSSQAKANAKVKDKGIIKGDMVLRYNSKLDSTIQKKFQIRWQGPFLVLDRFPNGTYQLVDLNGTLHKARVNGYRLKKYYARLMVVIEDNPSFEESADMVAIHEEIIKTSSFSLQALFTTTADHE